jgi:hypothetical protein
VLLLDKCSLGFGTVEQILTPELLDQAFHSQAS